MSDVVGGASALRLVPCCFEAASRGIDIRLGLCQLVLDLRHLEGSQQLSGIHPVTDVDRQRLDVSGHLGHDVDLLERLELAGKNELIRQIGAYDGRGRDDPRWLPAVGLRVRGAAAETREQEHEKGMSSHAITWP